MFSALADVVVNNHEHLINIGGDGLIHALLAIFLIGLCVLIVYAMGYFFLKQLPNFPWAMTIWNGLFVIIGGVVIINFLLSLVGHQFINW